MRPCPYNDYNVIIIFIAGPGNGSPMAINVVVVVVVVVVIVVVVVGTCCYRIFNLLKLFYFSTDRN